MLLLGSKLAVCSRSFTVVVLKSGFRVVLFNFPEVSELRARVVLPRVGGGKKTVLVLKSRTSTRSLSLGTGDVPKRESGSAKTRPQLFSIACRGYFACVPVTGVRA